MPTKSTTISNLVESDEEGYNPIVLDQSSWVIGTISGLSSATYPEQIFVFSDRAVIYGYYLTATVDSVEYILWLERFSDGPYELPSDGGSVAISANFGAS